MASTPKQLKIASFSAEVAPFAKVGGQADVTRSLPKALKRLGHDVIAVMPLYGTVDIEKYRLKKIAEDVSIQIDDVTVRKVNFWVGELMPGLPIYFVDHYHYFGSRKDIYGSKYDNKRFLFFSRNCSPLPNASSTANIFSSVLLVFFAISLLFLEEQN
jgi:starch synthase